MPFKRATEVEDITGEVAGLLRRALHNGGAGAAGRGITVHVSMFTKHGSTPETKRGTLKSKFEKGGRVGWAKTASEDCSGRTGWAKKAMDAILSTPLECLSAPSHEEGMEEEEEGTPSGRPSLRASTTQLRTPLAPRVESVQPSRRSRRKARIPSRMGVDDHTKVIHSKIRNRKVSLTKQEYREAKKMAMRALREQKKDNIWKEKRRLLQRHIAILADAERRNRIADICDDEANYTNGEALHIMKKANGVRFLMMAMLEGGKTGSFLNAVRVVCDSGYVSACERTLRSWFYEYNMNSGLFQGYNQSRLERDWILNEEDKRHKAEEFVRTHAQVRGAKNMTVADFAHYVNSEGAYTGCGLFDADPDVEDDAAITKEQLKDFGVQLPLSVETCRKWLIRLGAKFNVHGRSLYYDGHDDPKVVEYREAYVIDMLSFYKHMPIYRQLSMSEAREKISDGEYIARHTVTSDAGEQFVEICVDDFEQEFLDALSPPPAGSEDAEMVNIHGGTFSKDTDKHKVDGDDKVMIWEQDEVIYKSNSYHKAAWKLPGQSHISPKSDGAGIMISGFRSVTTGWLKLSFAELQHLEQNIGRKPTHFYHNGGDDCHYSFYFFSYGLNKSGYWNASLMMHQLEEIAAAVQIKFPEYNHKFIFDWSSCHDALPKSAWRVNSMKLSYGFSMNKKTGMPRAFESEDITLKKKYRNSPAGVDFMAGIDTGAADYDPKSDAAKYGIQRVKFSAGEKPFYLPWSQEDFTGQPKGLKQLIWERGLWKDGMTLDGGVSGTKMSVCHVMSQQPDIDEQGTVLEEVLGQHDNMVLVMLPKYHPELNGIERVWGRSKWYTRSHCAFIFPNLLKRVPESLFEGNIPVDMHRRFARKARDYVRMYSAAEADTAIGADVLSYRVAALVKKERKYKSHRCIPPSENEGDHRAGRRPWALVKERKRKAAELEGNEGGGGV
jgi:hypothetical protein